MATTTTTMMTTTKHRNSGESGGADWRGRPAGVHVPEHGAGGREPAQAAEEPADLRGLRGQGLRPGHAAP